MSVYCFALTYGNRWQFLRDMLQSFYNVALPETKLFVGVQAPSPEMEQFVSFVTNKLMPNLWNRVAFNFYTNNYGLNRYDELIQTWTKDAKPEDILVDLDDDSLFAGGFEDAFEGVLSDHRFGWVGIKEKNTPLIKFPGWREGNFNGYDVIESAVGGGMAATRKEVYDELGGFGIGKTLFDPEDARFQRKCIQAGYFTGNIMGVEYEHHGSWEWHIKYGTAQERMNSLFEAMQSGFLSEDQYRQELMNYAQAVS